MRGFVTKKCAQWLVGNLQKWAAEFGRVGTDRCAGEEGRRWRDHQGTVVSKPCSNSGGLFVKCEIQPVSPKGRRVLVCIPAGGDGRGWESVAVELQNFIGATRREVQSRRWQTGGRGEGFSDAKDICRSGSKGIVRVGKREGAGEGGTVKPAFSGREAAVGEDSSISGNGKILG